MTVCGGLEKTEDVHNISLKTMGSTCDFKKGYAPENSNFISFLEDGKTYVIIDSKSNYHHCFINLIIPALMAVETLNDKNLHFVLCELNHREGEENFDNLLIELLQERQINYTEINNLEFEYLNAKNFISINGSDVESGIPLLYNYLIDKYSVATKTPNKKIYISRKKYSSEDTRIDDEEVLENYFLAKGFQIVYPEDTITFKEQFELFNSCSTLAGLTGSGMTSLIFMQKNQKVIEIVSKLRVGFNHDNDGNIVYHYETHDWYKNFSSIKNHTHLSVSNLEKQADLVKLRLDEVFDSLGENF